MSQEVELLKAEIIKLKRELFAAKKVEQINQREFEVDQKLLTQGIAHEFNNILGSIEGYSEWALDSDSVEDYKEALMMAQIACRRSWKITKSLQNLSLNTEPSREYLILKDTFEDSIKKHFEKSLNGHQLTVNLGQEDIFADENQVFEVFVNLIKNAIESLSISGKKGTILVTSQKKEKEVLVVVQDDGVGVSSLVKDQIFYPFFTSKGVMGHSSDSTVDQAKLLLKQTQSDDSGSGLGLYICKKILIDHGGDLILNDSFEGGAQFVLSFPQFER